MGTAIAATIETDWDRFDPWRVQPVRHHLTEHPLLQLDRLRVFAKQLERISQIYTFGNEATADDNLDLAGGKHPNRKSAQETLQDIDHAKAWMVLRHVQDDPAYRGLVDAALDGVRPQIERRDPGMCYRAGWIVVSSPHTVTPFHMDHNHGILLQVCGHKTVYLWEPDDVAVVSESARDWFHGHHDLASVHWNEAYRARAHVFHLAPGEGVYIPLTSPHLVETGDEPSTTFTLSYNTGASRRNTLLHALHDRAHGIGIDLAPVGRHPVLDACLYAAAHSAQDLRRSTHRWLGHPLRFDGEAYASNQ